MSERPTVVDLMEALEASLAPFRERQLDIARRAGAMCIAAEPHRAAGEDWPCEKCLARVRSASAPASSLVVSGSAATGTGFDGAAGRDRRSAAAPPSTHNRPGTVDPEPAYRPNDLGQTGR